LQLNRIDRAEAALQRASNYDQHGAHNLLTAQLRAALKAARKKEEGTS
jgi:hypothetical protein